MFFILQNTAKYVTFQRKSHKRLHFAPSHIFSRKNLLHIKCIQWGYIRKKPTTPFTATNTKFHRCPHPSPPLRTPIKLCLRRRSLTSGHFFAKRTKYHSQLSIPKNSTTTLASHRAKAVGLLPFKLELRIS